LFSTEVTDCTSVWQSADFMKKQFYLRRVHIDASWQGLSFLVYGMSVPGDNDTEQS